jgi:chromosome segregation ATPase
MTLHRIKTAFSRHKTAYLTSILLIILISTIGLVYNSGSDNPSILKLKTYFDQAISRYAKPIYDKYVPAVEAPTPMQSEQRRQELEKNLEQAKISKNKLTSELSTQAALVADLQKKLQAFEVDQAAREAQLQKSRQETALLQTQLKELNTQNTSSETRLENLQTAHKALAADFQELKNTKEQVAELENALTVKDRMLTQSEQRQQELGKNLEQAKNSKDKLTSELSTQAALVADLQKRLETFRADQAALEDEYNKSMKRTAQLQAQVQQLKAKTSLSPVKPADFDLLEKPTSEMELPQEETESPNPADIIDWVLKKKSE